MDCSGQSYQQAHFSVGGEMNNFTEVCNHVSRFHDLDKSSDCACFFINFINTWVWWVGL
jgi:hypothetical protein